MTKNQIIGANTEQYATLPKTIQGLIDEAIAMGGEVEQLADRLFAFALPCRVTGGAVRLVIRGNVGYYVNDQHKNVIRGAHDIRQEMAYWRKQSKR